MDGAGNNSEWTYGSEFVLDAHQETSSAISYGGTWTTEASSSAYGRGFEICDDQRSLVNFTLHGE